MISGNFCLYNKYGHCKYRETCHRHHVNELCEETMCKTEDCQKRHPKKCRFYLEFKYCKFGSYCSFSHKIGENVIGASEFALENVKVIQRNVGKGK